MKYSEAEEQIKALSSKYDIDMIWGLFEVVYNGKTCVICVNGSYEYGLYVSNVNKFSGMPFSNKLYMILAELAMTPIDERVEEKKYQVKAFGDYLNLNVNTSHAFLFDGSDTEYVKTEFTLKEIEQLKQRDDIPLDWNKVTFEEVEDE